MQSLTNEQADAVLDVVKQCELVADTYRIKEDSRRRMGSWRTPQGRQLLKRKEQDYREAVESATKLYLVAFDLGVGENILNGIINRNIPEGVKIPLEIAKA